MFSLCHSVSSFPPPLPHLPFLKQDFSFSITSQDMYFLAEGNLGTEGASVIFFSPLADKRTGETRNNYTSVSGELPHSSSSTSSVLILFIEGLENQGY